MVYSPAALYELKQTTPQSAAARFSLVHQHQQIKPSHRPVLLSC